MFKGAEREWRFYLADMIAFADKVLLYTHELDQERFVSSGLNYDIPILLTRLTELHKLHLATPQT